MALDDIRDRARAQVHAQFGLPVTVRSADGSVEISVDATNKPLIARLHRDLKKPFGDLDREGFALVIEFCSRVIIDKRQWVPIRNYRLDFGRHGVVRIDNFVSNGDYVYCDIVDSKE